jgi:hypothetical protein
VNTLPTHPDTCRCPLHFELQAKRDAAYRHLALSILGPHAPQDSDGLACALAIHARNFSSISQQRAA